jgi:hypothetical protein
MTPTHSVSYNSITARLATLGEVLSCVTSIVDPGAAGEENWKPADNPNRAQAVTVQARLLDEISGLLSAAEPKLPATRRTS